MRRHVGLARALDEAVLVVVLVGADGQSASPRSSVQHRQRRIHFGRARRGRGLGVDHQGVPIVGQDMADKA